MTKAARLSAALLALTLLAFGTAAAEAQVDYSAQVGVGASDNITRGPAGGQSDTIALAGLMLDVVQERRKLDANVHADLSYLDYLDNTYGSEVVGRFDGRGRLQVAAEHVYWVLQDNFGQAQVDRFAAVTPANRENVNYFMTGPDLTFRMGSSGFVDLEGRYSTVRYEVSDLDSDRGFAGLAVGKRFAEGSSVSINANNERFQFDNPASPDYDRRSAYLRYQAQGARTRLGVNVGATQIDADRTSSALLAQVDASRTLSHASTLSLALGTQLTDAGDSFRDQQTGIAGGGITAPPSLTSAAFKRRYAGVTWRFERNRTELGLSARHDDDSYDQQPAFDAVRTGFEASVSRRLSSVTSARIYGSYLRTVYDNVDFQDTDKRVGASGDYWVGKNLVLSLQYEHNSRSTTNFAFGYDENRGFFTISYRSR